MKKKFAAMRPRTIRAPHRSDRKIPAIYGHVMKPTGWGGGYNRPAPRGAHKCLSRSEMAALMAGLE